MDGFIVVKLMANTTFNGSFSGLNTPDIEKVYTILDPDPKGGGGGRPHFIPVGSHHDDGYVESPGTWHRFSGAGTIALYTTVAWWPLIALLVCAARKWVIDRQHAARVNPARARTPPLGGDGFELQPVVGGNGPAPAPAPAAGDEAQELPDWLPSITEKIVVLFWLVGWRAIQLAIMLQMMIFQSRLVPWLESTEMRNCMATRWRGMDLPAYAVVFIVLAIVVFIFESFQAFYMVLCTLHKWQERRLHYVGANGLLTAFSPSVRFIIGASSITAFGFAMCSFYFRGCANSDMYEDMKMFMYAFIPLWGWAIIDYLGRPIERHYQKYWGFPTNLEW
ncbi:hypothetical protein PG987_000373 [Apiospora arundinis]